MLDYIPSFLRAEPTPPALRVPSAPEPLVLSAFMRTDDETLDDEATLAAQDRFDRLFASL